MSSYLAEEVVEKNNDGRLMAESSRQSICTLRATSSSLLQARAIYLLESSGDIYCIPTIH